LSALKESVRQEVAATVQPQYDFLQAIRAELPDEGILVDEVTQVGYASNYGYPVYKPRTTVSSGYQGTLGFGFATALGVKVAHPDTPVVSISGDGGFMYNVQELSTAVLHKISLVTVVFTDGAFGNVLRMQRENYGGKVIASNLHNPDFVKLAENFGAAGVRAHGPEELRVAIREGLKREGPTLIEVPVGEMADPWKLFFFPRARGK
jgi:acetolactate synthase-1/2/3 large subunit